jgi:pyridoxine 5-phosphate synthase
MLAQVCQVLRADGIRSSLFFDPYDFQPDTQVLLKTIATDRVELYTEAYADSFATDREKGVLSHYAEVGQHLWAAGFAINAGHDLNQKNLSSFLEALPWTSEVSIGHALVCEALYQGWEKTISAYLACLGAPV